MVPVSGKGSWLAHCPVNGRHLLVPPLPGAARSVSPLHAGPSLSLWGPMISEIDSVPPQSARFWLHSPHTVLPLVHLPESLWSLALEVQPPQLRANGDCIGSPHWTMERDGQRWPGEAWIWGLGVPRTLSACLVSVGLWGRLCPLHAMQAPRSRGDEHWGSRLHPRRIVNQLCFETAQ